MGMLAALGSIPACAGEPAKNRISLASAWVYPRLRGGTAVRDRVAAVNQGLSPLARGNLNFPAVELVPCGSIPACAGEPVAGRRVATPRRVYPRLRGGTGFFEPFGVGFGGLSPLARGNRLLATCISAPIGSIPACAGEPRRDDLRA